MIANGSSNCELCSLSQLFTSWFVSVSGDTLFAIRQGHSSVLSLRTYAHRFVRSVEMSPNKFLTGLSGSQAQTQGSHSRRTRITSFFLVQETSGRFIGDSEHIKDFLFGCADNSAALLNYALSNMFRRCCNSYLLSNQCSKCEWTVMDAVKAMIHKPGRRPAT